MMQKNVFLLLFLSSLTFSGLTLAGDLVWHGFGAQGVIQANDSNYINDDGDVSYRLTEVGLNTSYRINQKLRVSAQGIYINGGNRFDEGVRIDYLFLDYQVLNSPRWNINAHFGRYKNYHWLYSATRDVPHTMPSIVLPQSSYFDAFRNASLGSDGISLTAQHLNSLGEWDIRWSYGNTQIKQEQTENLMSTLATGELNHDFDTQFSVSFSPLGTGLSLGGSFLSAGFSYNAGENDVFIDGEVALERFMLSLSYSAEHWDINAEAMREKTDFQGFFFDQRDADAVAEGLYVQGRLFVSPDVTLLARIDTFDANNRDRNGSAYQQASGGAIPAYFAFRDQLTLGASWDFADNWRVRGEFHKVKGRARLAPVFIPDIVINDSKYWDIWALQIIYWF
ncbi:MAG: TonB-dependent receptor [Paraglaciecola sp.]